MKLINKILKEKGYLFPKDVSWKNIQLLLDLGSSLIVKNQRNEIIILTYTENDNLDFTNKLNLKPLSIIDIKNLFKIIDSKLHSEKYNMEKYPNIAFDLILYEQIYWRFIKREKLCQLVKN